MADKQLRQAIINPTQVLVSDGTEVESNLGYFNLGAIGRDLLATDTKAEARTAIGSPAFAGDGTATVTTNSVVRSQIDSSGNVSSTIPGGSTLLPEFKCRAWVNFDGKATPPNIRGSGNISSVARSATGDYTINFSTAMPDANYAVTATADLDGYISATQHALTPPTASSFRVGVFNPNYSNTFWLQVIVHR